MKPFELCPVCQVPVRWIVCDVRNDYECPNKECPIQFSEHVGFKKDETNLHLKNGFLFHYRFKIDKYRLAIYYKESNSEMGFFIRVNLAGTEKRDFLPPFPIDWHNLELLKQKVKILLTFS